MTTIIPFLPSNITAPIFTATFDGATYRVVITWNISAQRFYVNIYDQGGMWIVTVPLFQSPPARAVNSVSYDIIRRVMTIEMDDPSHWPIPLNTGGTGTKPGTMVDYTLENFDPPVLNAKWRSIQLNETTFSFPLADDPGAINIVGSVSRYLNMVNGLFQSTLIYRNGAFEVNP
jgi:hypothetical protein